MKLLLGMFMAVAVFLMVNRFTEQITLVGNHLIQRILGLAT